MTDLEVIAVIRTHLERCGRGTEDDPVRILEQYWDMSGKCLFEYDRWAKEIRVEGTVFRVVSNAD